MDDLELLRRTAIEARVHSDRCKAEILEAANRIDHLRATVLAIDANMLACNVELLLARLTKGKLLE